MKKNWKVLAAMFVGSSMMMISCGGGDADKKEEKKETKEVTKPVEDVDTTTNDVMEYDPEMTYAVPTPNELFAVLKEIQLPFKPELMNPVANVDNYTDKSSQSLNLGVYFADLAMDGNLNEAKNSTEYIKSVLKLGEALNITGAFDDAIIDKLTSGGSTEEMAELSNDTYYDAYSYLEENQRGATLSMIVIGGWVESLYLMSHSGEFEENGDFAAIVADQKLTMENLMGYLMEYQDDEEVMGVMEEMIELDEFFMNLEEEGESELTTSEEEGVYILSGGAETKISAEDFTTLKTLVSDLRNAIINAEI